MTSQSRQTLTYSSRASTGKSIPESHYDSKVTRFSLSATFYRNRIVGALRAFKSPSVRQAAQNVSSNLIFENPTVEQLASTIATLVDPSSTFVNLVLPARSAADNVKAMIAKYTANLPTTKAKAKSRDDAAPVVLLTGSTGNIGSHILAYLLSEGRIGRVYALNRPSDDPLGRLRSAFADRGLPVKVLDDPRLVSLTGDITRDDFGLEDIQYKEVCSKIGFEIEG